MKSKLKISILLMSALMVPFVVNAAKEMDAKSNQCTEALADRHIIAGEVSTFLRTTNSLEAVKWLVKNYVELNWLTGDVQASPEGHLLKPDAKNLSEKIFGLKHIEFDRTITGLLVIKWLLTDDFEIFTAPQDTNNKLTKDNFKELSLFTREILSENNAIDAMLTYMTLSDLGKVTEVIDRIKNEMGNVNVDHDKVLIKALKEKPEWFPSFQRLSETYKNRIVHGLQAEFNVAQFVQGENVPASLSGLRGLDQADLDLYLLHSIADIAGAAGHINSQGSMVLNNPTYENFRNAVKSLQALSEGSSEIEVYNAHLRLKAESLNQLNRSNPSALILNHDSIEHRSIIRLAAMLRINDSEKLNALIDSYLNHPAKFILNKVMNISGMEDLNSILLYYSPALLKNITDAYIKDQKFRSDLISYKAGLDKGLSIMAELYQLGQSHIKNVKGSGVFTLQISDIAEAAKTPQVIDEMSIRLQSVGKDAKAVLANPLNIDPQQFTQISGLKERFSGQRIGIIGIGGGSDGVQAAQLALLLKEVGKNVPFVISIRSSKTSSQGKDNLVGENRNITDHGGELSAGVYKVLSSSNGSGRFLESVPANDVDMFLVVSSQENDLSSQIKSVMSATGGVDTIVAVDTGGDALFSPLTVPDDQVMSTPNQDLNVLLGLSNIDNVKKFTAIIAPGIDAPGNASEILHQANASYYFLSQHEKEAVLAKYENWDMTGKNNERFGKTAFAWQKALKGEFGLQMLAIPERAINDHRNPWNPYIRINKAMSGIFIMDLNALLISSTKILFNETDIQLDKKTRRSFYAIKNYPNVDILNRQQELFSSNNTIYTMLLTPSEYNSLPNGVGIVVPSIKERKIQKIIFKGEQNIDMETRQGVLAYGILLFHSLADKFILQWDKELGSLPNSALQNEQLIRLENMGASPGSLVSDWVIEKKPKTYPAGSEVILENIIDNYNLKAVVVADKFPEASKGNMGNENIKYYFAASNITLKVIEGPSDLVDKYLVINTDSGKYSLFTNQPTLPDTNEEYTMLINRPSGEVKKDLRFRKYIQLDSKYFYD
ncbi:MAG: DUF1152 domain-containing protein [Bdellovibrionaceae bacterium]|nr:DUF1152 domain-containing protein [Pseudobdellovibrionaceae bacterium]